MDEMSIYQVVITGIDSRHMSWLLIIEELARLLRISFHESHLWLEQTPHVVRGQLSRQQAELYCRVLRRIGVVAEYASHVESPPPRHYFLSVATEPRRER